MRIVEPGKRTAGNVLPLLGLPSLRSGEPGRVLDLPRAPAPGRRPPVKLRLVEKAGARGKSAPILRLPIVPPRAE